MRRYSIVLLFAAMLSSCGIYEKWHSDADVPGNLFGEDYVSRDTCSIARLHWTEMFTDSLLQELIDTALVRNTELRTARLRVEQAQARLRTARLALVPSLELVPQGSISHYGTESSLSYNVGASASWEIDIFGKHTAAKRGAAADVLAQMAYSQAVRTSLVSSVASSYYMLLMLDEKIDISVKMLGTWDNTLSVLRALQISGKVNETAVLQAQASRLSLESELVSLRTSVKETENALSLLLAQTPSGIRRNTLADADFPDSLSAGLPLQILSRRPDVLRAEMNMAKAFYAVNAARAAFYPSIRLAGNAGWTNEAGGIVAIPGKWLLGAVLSLAQPLFNRGVNKANLKIAEADREIAAMEFSQALLKAGNEVNDALSALQSARERQALDIQNVAVLEEAVRKTELLMRHSSVNYLEVITARQSCLAALQAVAQDRFDEISAIISLYHALGGG